MKSGENRSAEAQCSAGGVARSRATVMRWLTVAAKLLIRELVVCTQLIQGPTSVSAAAARTMTAQTSLFKLNES